MTAGPLFKVETHTGQVMGLFRGKEDAKHCRNGFPTLSGCGATVHRGPVHRLGETGKTRHELFEGNWIHLEPVAQPDLVYMYSDGLHGLSDDNVRRAPW